MLKQANGHRERTGLKKVRPCGLLVQIGTDSWGEGLLACRQPRQSH